MDMEKSNVVALHLLDIGMITYAVLNYPSSALMVRLLETHVTNGLIIIYFT